MVGSDIEKSENLFELHWIETNNDKISCSPIDIPDMNMVFALPILFRFVFFFHQLFFWPSALFIVPSSPLYGKRRCHLIKTLRIFEREWESVNEWTERNMKNLYSSLPFYWNTGSFPRTAFFSPWLYSCFQVQSLEWVKGCCCYQYYAFGIGIVRVISK